MKIYVDGVPYGERDARISLLDRGMRAGLGLRGHFLCRDGAFFALDGRLEQMQSAAKELALPFPWELPDIKESLAVTYDMNGFDGREALLELILTAGAEPKGKVDGEKPPEEEEFFAQPAHAVTAKKIVRQERQPVRLELLRDSDLSAATVLRERYLLGQTTTALARARAGAGAILLGSDGNVAACTEGELFAVTDGHLWAPEAPYGTVDRSNALELLSDLERPCAVRSVRPKELNGVSECFLLTDDWELVPVGAIGKAVVGSGKAGPVAAALAEDLPKKLWAKAKAPF
ncbi:MAG: aminotransferase class IV [Puniceicoccales bacterium]|jgi:branched-chain amino acid aminotransferase|nr:aminotransferase class IV [Puniceicoccales bacterium]